MQNYNSVLIYNDCQENIANKYVSIFGNLKYLWYCCLYLSYRQNQLSPSPIHFKELFIQQKQKNSFRHLC